MKKGGASKVCKSASVALCMLIVFSISLAFPTGAVADSWTQVNVDGFGGENNTDVNTMCMFGSNLYAGTYNYGGCEVWRTANGTDWNKTNANGFGEQRNKKASAMCVFNSELYVGTECASAEQGCQLWRSANGTDWAKANTDGFGDWHNWGIYSMCVFGSYLYAGTRKAGPKGDNITGCEIWRSSNGTDWTKVNTDGFGDDNNKIAYSMDVLGSNLYVGTHNFDGCEIWRSSNGTDWTQVNANGFGDIGNEGVFSLFEFGSCLYAGTFNWGGCQVWKSANGTDWSRANMDGFGNSINGGVRSLCEFGSKLYAGTQNNNQGGEVWRCDDPDANNWTKVNTNGFGNPYQLGVGSMCVFGSNLYAGTMSWDSCKVWRTDGQPPYISSISPSKGYVGTSITIFGHNFGSVQGDSNITVNGTAAAVTSWADDEIHATVPDAATTGPVVVTVPGDSSNRDKIFTVTPTPTTWYLAEGSTAWGFNTYITIENPSDQVLHAKLTYMDPSAPASGNGIAATRTVELPPLSQTTIDPRWDIDNIDFSTRVECLEGRTIAVDRTMFWTGEGATSPEGHSSVGVNSPSKAWYLPEGSCAWGFESWTLVQNPNPGEAKVTLTYMIEGQGPKTVEKTVPGYSRSSWSMADDLGFPADASVKVTSDSPVIAEQSMYKNNRREGSCSVGAVEPAADYYLAEGTTQYGFTTYILVQNPNNEEVEVTVTYMTNEGPKEHPKFTMGPDSRKTIRANDVSVDYGYNIDLDADFSTQVHGSKPIIAARSMYWGLGTPQGEAMHSSTGLSSSHKTFYLPDGQSGDGYETYTLVQNPNPDAVTVELSYLPQGGGNRVTFTDKLPANSRKTYNMEDKGINGRAATKVTCRDVSKKIMVERAMYWNSRGAGTDTIGGYND